MLSKLHRRHLAQAAQKFSDREQRIYDFLTTHPIAVLSSVDPSGEPHGTVIYYTLNQDFQLFFITRTGTKKYDNLIRNNHAMLTIFDPRTQTTVQVTGIAEEIIDSYEVNNIAGSITGISLKTSEGGLLPITKLEEGEFTAFQVKPVQIRMAVYDRPDPGSYEDLFESIESFDLYE